MGSRRMTCAGVVVEIEYIADRDDGDYGTVWFAIRSASDDQKGEELVCFSLLIEEVPYVMSLLELVKDEYFEQRRSTRPMRDAKWIR